MKGFVEYPDFEAGYEALKKATDGFASLPRQKLVELVGSTPICFVLLRTMLGFTPPEWAYVTTQRKGMTILQGFARTLDRRIRMEPLRALRSQGEIRARVASMVETACELLEEGCPTVPVASIHRLQKADTIGGLVAVRNMASLGVPYAMLLYERFLGRPFAGHRDSVSELVGDVMESAVEEILARSTISFRKTRRAE